MRCAHCRGEMVLRGRAPSRDWEGDSYVYTCPARECAAREVTTRYPVVPPGLPVPPAEPLPLVTPGPAPLAPPTQPVAPCAAPTLLPAGAELLCRWCGWPPGECRCAGVRP